MKNGEHGIRFTYIEYCLVLATFLICLTGASLIGTNYCPDEGGRQMLSGWIFTNGTLPTGNELETILPLWGFSYALRPYLASIINAGFMKLFALFTTSPQALRLASRMCSVCSVTLSCVYCLRFGHRVFKKRLSAILFALVVCWLPQVMFLGMYQNNDSLSLAAACMIVYYLAEGDDLGWPARSCIGLGIAFSVALLSYYSVYGWILTGVVFCIVSVIRNDRIADKAPFILKRALWLAAVCLLLAGWFFIRNARLHEGDFLGLASEDRSRVWAESQGVEVRYTGRSLQEEGYSLIGFFRYSDFHWIKKTLASFIGVFGYLNIYMPVGRYIVYCVIFGLSALGYIVTVRRGAPSQRDRHLFAAMLGAGAITFILHVYQSYCRDFQAQGRYVITAILPIAYMIAYSFDRAEDALGVPARGTLSAARAQTPFRPGMAFALVWIVLLARTVADTMTKMLA